MNHVGVYGLGVMGQSLAKNLLNHGYKVSVCNRRTSVTEDFAEKEKGNLNLSAFDNIQEFINSLEKPRKLILMVTAGKVVDDVIQQVLPYLSAGDIIMECGNAYYQDTIRRITNLKDTGIRYLGIGVSGGEKGALEGPSIMVGGDASAYQETDGMLENIAAKAYDGKSCCAYVGEGGAGHFIKMVHNGIEYAIIQTICELYDLLRKAYGYTAPEISEVFGELNQGILNSYLMEITEQICKKKDDLSDAYLIDRILDKAGQKGTGKWTCQEGIEMGIPIPTIVEAVSSRNISSDYENRKILSKKYESGKSEGRVREEKEELIRRIEGAAYIANICIYNQAFALIEHAKGIFGWEMDLSEVTQIWRNGCIIRATLLDDLNRAVLENGSNLLMNETFCAYIRQHRSELNQVLKDAISCQISVPCLSSSVSYLNEYTDAESSANLLQAQRDYFGAHTYERNDREGIFHTQWES